VESGLDAAAAAMGRGDLAAAENSIRSYLLKNPDDPRGLELAADISARRSETAEAIANYQEALVHAEAPSEPLMDKLAIELMKAGRGMESLDLLEQRVERFPNHLQARFDLVGLAAMLGFPEKAIPSLRWLAQHGKSDPETLQVLSDPQRVQPDDQLCQKLLKSYPIDQRLQYSLARLDANDLNWTKVLEKLEPVLDQHPDFLPAHTLYGRALTELNRFRDIPQWQQQLPAEAPSSPEYWLVAGAWAESEGRNAEAAKCYWEGVRLDQSGHPELLPRLARTLRQIGREEDAAKVDEQISRRAALRDALTTHFVRSAKSQRAAMAVAEAMLDLGRLWEAEGWARLAASLPEDRLPDIRDRYMAIRSKLTVDSPWQSPDRQLASILDLSELPSLDWQETKVVRRESKQRDSGQIYFEDQASQRGWVHTCEVAPEAIREGHWIYQSMGGGVGVIDFDLDGWPDLAAAMLNGRPLELNSSPNRLFRNRGGEFAECTAASDYVDTGFGQGIAIGDFNSDGFPDIFDANIGRNRLYRNNGDGTFQEVSESSGLNGAVWTTSAVIADIDNDGYSDLFETAYCGGRQPYEVPCRNRQGLFSTCTPLNFEAELDQIWQGQPDGSFLDVTDQWMDQSSPGRGMGIQVGLIDDRPGLDIYVANDMTVNHLWSAEANDTGFRLTDVAAVRGVGVSGRSFSQASMGIAAGDPDGDGDVDLFVTHFADDHNTFYEQTGPGLWTDRSFQVGLGEASMKQLGFGTEWVDFDNNGTVELIVTNGHVDDIESEEIAYRMKPQLFQLDGTGSWTELNSESLGEYFTKDHLGRALATIDVDNDGQVDLAITHLYDPVSLLMNRATNVGNSITLELKATRGQRDAIGAVVTAKIGPKQITQQLFAGDGYMCSNQRRITIGVGNASEMESVSVQWPSGSTENFGTVPAGRDLLLVEGSAEAFELGEHR
jgi:tetratricopeptide (TPR) repeat protein